MAQATLPLLAHETLYASRPLGPMPVRPLILFQRSPEEAAH